MPSAHDADARRVRGEDVVTKVCSTESSESSERVGSVGSVGGVGGAGRFRVLRLLLAEPRLERLTHERANRPRGARVARVKAARRRRRREARALREAPRGRVRLARRAQRRERLRLELRGEENRFRFLPFPTVFASGSSRPRSDASVRRSARRPAGRSAAAGAVARRYAQSTAARASATENVSVLCLRFSENAVGASAMSAAARTRVVSLGALRKKPRVPDSANPLLVSSLVGVAPPPGVHSATAASARIADAGPSPKRDACPVRSRAARLACVAATRSPFSNLSTKRSRSPSRPPPSAAAARATAPASRSHRCFRVCAAARRSAGRAEKSDARRRGTSLAGVATLGAKIASCCTYVAASWRHAPSPASVSRTSNAPSSSPFVSRNVSGAKCWSPFFSPSKKEKTSPASPASPPNAETKFPYAPAGAPPPFPPSLTASISADAKAKKEGSCALLFVVNDDAFDIGSPEFTSREIASSSGPTAAVAAFTRRPHAARNDDAARDALRDW